jgi:threonine dehydratase
VTAALRPPKIADIEAAARRLEGAVVQTPLLESAALNERLGGRLLVKAECLQRTGSFKLRGAYNRIAQLSAAERKRGVVAFSSGNHAQGVASAAAQLKTRATIVMPRDAPAVKIANTRNFGAKVVLYDRFTESRETIAGEIAKTQGATLVPPFEDPHIIAGQGTVGLEIMAQAAALGVHLDAVAAPASGGGLVAGIAIAMAARSPRTRIFAAEPQGFDDLARSLKSGRRMTNKPGKASICDALMSPSPGKLTLAILRALKARSVAVSDKDALAAMAEAFSAFHIVVEPGGAAALAAVLTGRIPIRGKCVAVVCSGGNADPALFASALTGKAAKA